MSRHTLSGNLLYLLFGLVVFGLLLVRPAADLGPPPAAPIQVAGAPLTSALLSAGGGRLPGVDVSHYQGRVAWRQVADSGVEFVFLKSTEGIHYVDPRYHRNAQALARTALLAGAYHFYDPAHDPIEQAEHFLATVEIGKGSLPPVLDVETARDLTPEAIRSGVIQWMRHVEQRTGCRPVLYTNPSFWRRYLDPQLATHPLWLAQYAPKPKLPEGVDNWTFWQHSDRGEVAGIEGGVDLNWFDGDVSALTAITCNG